MELREILNTFNSENKEEITNMLSYLEDCFESYSSFKDINLIVQYLINEFELIKDEEIKEMILDVIQIAVTYKSEVSCDFICLSKNINNLSDSLVLGIIAIYECTCDKKYIPILEMIRINGNNKIANEAQATIDELMSM